MSSIQYLRPSFRTLVKQSTIKPYTFQRGQQLIRTFTSFPIQLSTSSKSKNNFKKPGKFSLFVDKLRRVTRFTFSSSLVLAAIALSGASMYFLFTELFAPSGETSTFNRVVSMIEKNEECLRLLGYSEEQIKSGKKIRLKAYGEEAGDKWSRNRPFQTAKFIGQEDGLEHLLMKFYVETENHKVGTVQLEALEQNFIEQSFVYITLEVKGEPRHYLVGKPKTSITNVNPLGAHNLMNIKWGPKKD